VALNTKNLAIRFVLCIYAMLMFLTPLYWHVSEEYVVFGNDLKEYMPYTITYYSLAIISMMIGYYFGSFVYPYKKEKHSLRLSEIPLYIIRTIFFINISIVIYWAVSTGYGIKSLFLINLIYKPTSSLDIYASSGFISLFVESLIVSSSMYVLNSKSSKVEKLMVLFLTLVIFLGLGFRFRLILIFLIISLSTLIIYNFDKGKVKKLVVIGLICLSLLISFSYVRNYVKQINRGVDIENVASDQSTADKLFSNTRNFYSLTSLIKYIDNNKGEYDYGETMFLNIAYRFIPKSFFDGGIKPRPVGVEQSALSWENDEGYYAGEAYSNIGDYYQAYGVAGIVIFMLILGVVIARLSINLSAENGLTLSAFRNVIIISSFFQLITRGYLPQYVLILIYLLLPIFFVRISLSFHKKNQFK